MRIEQIIVTPDLAQKYLEKNYKNRKIRESHVEKLAFDMKAGNWTESPDPICFDTEGNLINGQHRLSAVVKSGVSVLMNVAFDLPVDTVIDKGKERDTGDALYLRGLIEKDASTREVIAVARRYIELSGRDKNISDTEMAKFLNENYPMIREAISLSRTGAHKAICKNAATQSAIFAALTQGVDYDKLFSFTSIVNTGFMSNQSQSAAIVLRNYILEQRLYGSGSSPLNERSAFAQMAIRDFVNGVPRRVKYSKLASVYIPNGKKFLPRETNKKLKEVAVNE